MAAPIRATATRLKQAHRRRCSRPSDVGGGVNVIGRGHQYDVSADGRFLVNVDTSARRDSHHAAVELETGARAESDVATIH